MITKKQPRSRVAARLAPSVSQLEKTLLTLPVQMLKTITQDLAVLKRTDSQLKQALSQLGKRIKQNMPRKQAIQLNKRSQALTKQLKEVAKQIQLALQKQDKALHLKKHLTQFEKTWVTTSKTNHAIQTKPVKQRAKQTKPAADAMPHTKSPSITEMLSIKSQTETVKNPAQNEQKESEAVEA